MTKKLLILYIISLAISIELFKEKISLAMNDKELDLPLDIYYEHLETISGVKFTRREIDIIAFLISGRSVKKIASFFNISPKTVENYTRNIMQKLGCNSRDGIVDFIEKAPQLVLIKKYYIGLLIQASFECSLKSISTLTNMEVPPKCLIIYWSETGHHDFYIESLQKHISRSGIKVSTEVKGDQDFLKHLIHDIKSRDFNHIIIVLSKIQITNLLTREAVQYLTTSPQALDTSTFFVHNKSNLTHFIKELCDRGEINFGYFQSYYQSILMILKKMLPGNNIDPLITEFIKQLEVPHDFSKNIYPAPLIEPLATSGVYFKKFINLLYKNKQWVFFGVSVSVSSICVLSLFFKDHTDLPTGMQNSVLEPSIRSDLVIPSESTLLNRLQLMTRIEKDLKGSQGIQTLALIGIGGAGKTTIARQYARLQKSSVIWEINTETKGNIISAFENLVYYLVKTEGEKKILREIQEIKNSLKREERIFILVREKLKSLPNWFLIYDNVERLTDIQKYFPSDPTLWGTGKVILTTRNGNIQNNRLIKKIVQVGELDQKEKLDLFIKIMDNRGNVQFPPFSQEQTKEFLEHIPPFPLDVSVAANYLNVTNIPYEKYLEYLNKNEVNFTATQENILKELTTYTKSRYKIISLSLKHLIEIDKDFKDLLLFISLLDSQNIPRDLLASYKSNIVVDNFIYHLKKYSFLIRNQLDPSCSTSILSIHKSTQDIIFSYLLKTYNLKKDECLLQSISNTFESYINSVMDKEDFAMLKILINHCKIFLSHDSLLNNFVNGCIVSKLGYSYFHIGDYIKAEQILEESLEKLKKCGYQNYPKITQTLMYLGNTYRELGKYEIAKKTLEQCLALYKKHPTKTDIGIARVLGYLGNVHKSLGNYEKARDLLEQSLLLYRERFANFHAEIAWSLGHLGNVYRELGKYDNAKSSLEESLLIYKTYFSTKYSSIAKILGYLGNVYRNLGDYNKSKDAFEQSLIIYQQNFSENHPNIPWALAHLGNIYRELGDYQKAKELLEKSFVVNNKIFPTGHTRTAWILVYLSNIYRELGDYQKAKELLEKSIIIYKKNLPKDHIDIAYVLVHLGIIHRFLGNYHISKNLIEQNLAIYKQHYSDNHFKMAWVFAQLGSVYRELGDYGKAQRYLKYSLLNYKTHFGKDHFETAQVLRNLGRVYISLGDFETAENFFSQALKIFERNRHPESFMPLEDLADLQLIKATEAINKKDISQFNRDNKLAMNYLTQALKIIICYFPSSSPHIKRIQLKIKKLG